MMKNEQRLQELENRRKRAARLLSSGMSQAEVARQVGVSKQSVLRWERIRQSAGTVGLERPNRFGRPAKLDDRQRRELVAALEQGALSAGFASELWTLARVGKLIKDRFGVELTQSSVWRVLGDLGWRLQRRPTGQAWRRDEERRPVPGSANGGRG